MAQDHLELLEARRPTSAPRPSPIRQMESHVVVATQNLPRVSGAIQALIKAGHMVTAYASPTRLLPRLGRFTRPPVSLLIIDGGLPPAFARAAAIAAHASYPDLPIILLATGPLLARAQSVPAGVTLLALPISDGTLVTRASMLLARQARARAWSG